MRPHEVLKARVLNASAKTHDRLYYISVRSLA